ncbi:MAG: hypothetical protein WC677_08865 [Clostridia bacterium]|jgi:hypothetical protein
MKTPRDKYLNDVKYKMLVDMMIASIDDCNYTPSEMREASVLASILYEERHIRRYCIPIVTEELEKSLNIIHKYVSQSEVIK